MSSSAPDSPTTDSPKLAIGSEEAGTLRLEPPDACTLVSWRVGERLTANLYRLATDDGLRNTLTERYTLRTSKASRS